MSSSASVRRRSLVARLSLRHQKRSKRNASEANAKGHDGRENVHYPFNFSACFAISTTDTPRAAPIAVTVPQVGLAVRVRSSRGDRR